MVVMVLLHMTQVFLHGAYKYPRELTWVLGVLLLLCTMGMFFTGQVLRWDPDAYWGLAVGGSMAGRVPVIPHIPFAGDGSHGNVPTYNAAVDELARENQLQIGPDLYTHFMQHADDEFVCPPCAGTISQASLSPCCWFQNSRQPSRNSLGSLAPRMPPGVGSPSE